MSISVTLEKKPTKENLEWLYGLLVGFILCTTGHRKGAVTNMTVEEVTSAQFDSSERRIIRVRTSLHSDH